MPYFTDASSQGRVLSRQLPRLIGVIESLDKRRLIGTASERGRTDEGLALWKLKIRGIEFPGWYTIVDGEFGAYEATAE